MTKQKTAHGYVFIVHIYEDYSDMIDNCDFSLYVAPRSMGAIRPNYPKDESHIIRGGE